METTMFNVHFRVKGSSSEKQGFRISKIKSGADRIHSEHAYYWKIWPWLQLSSVRDAGNVDFLHILKKAASGQNGMFQGEKRVIATPTRKMDDLFEILTLFGPYDEELCSWLPFSSVLDAGNVDFCTF